MGSSLCTTPRWQSRPRRKCLLSFSTYPFIYLSLIYLRGLSIIFERIVNKLQVNRNKKSIGVSFKDPKGADLIRQLALQADVFVENYLPGTLKKYGLDFKTLSEANPKLIYASVTGYGQTGPYSNRAGYDVMVEA